MGQRLATCHNNEIAKFPIAPSKNPYFIDRGIARKGSNQARSVEVGIPPDLANDLKSLRELYPETVHIFESPITKKPIVKPHTRWKTFLKKNGFPDIRFHDLRHSFATYTLEQANFTLIELRDHLGHASVATTQIYTKASHKSTAKKLSLFMT